MPSSITYENSYDPVKAHEYYERTKKLKGRKRGSSSSSSGSSSSTPARLSPAARKVNRLQSKVNALNKALSETRQALSATRQDTAKTEKKNSDGKTTVSERTAAKKYRDTHKAEIENKRKSAKSAGPKDISSMSAVQLRSRIVKLQDLLSEAKRQLNEAKNSLQHADFIDPDLKLSDLMLRHSSRRKDTAVETADFSGVATAYGLKCSDGRTILPGAFDLNDGMQVPLVWQHGHDQPSNILGHVKLSKSEDGMTMRCDAFFNATAEAQSAKEMVKHGDVKFLSVWANELVERVTNAATRAKDVIKGNIREVSLVLAGANPGAMIDNIAFGHGDEYDAESDEALITTGLEIEVGGVLTHASEETVEDVLNTLTPKQMNAVTFLVNQAMLGGSDDSLEHSDTDGDDAASDDDSGDAESSDDEGESADSEGTDESSDSEDTEDADTNDGSDETEESEESTDSDASEGSEDSDDSDAEAGDTVQHNDNPGGQSMTHNVFDQARADGSARPQVTLSHDAIKSIVQDAQKNGSLKGALENYVSHTGVTVDGTLQHGIENIEYLFPDSKLLETSPQFISRRMEWVDNVLNAVRKSPFSRIKTVTADITPDEARARGYVKGNLKNEEFFAMSKRETTPQTVYKKQKLDRDDVIDIVDLDVVAWLKAEMKVMLDEELAGAILCGDGRSNGDDDKIFETKIRPVATDAELYVTVVNVNLLDASSSVEELVDAAINSRRFYKGSGTPTFYTTESTISAFLTVKDGFGRRIYNTLAEVASTLRVKEVVPVEIMERDATLIGIMVNLADYTLGADRGGQATMFDDFDIDYNKLLYLIETRVSGALTVPKSALVFRAMASGDVLLAGPPAPAFNETTSEVTVPTVTGITYKVDNAAGATLTTGAPVELDEGEDLHVIAIAGAGKYFANNAQDEWDFTGVEHA